MIHHQKLWYTYVDLDIKDEEYTVRSQRTRVSHRYPLWNRSSHHTSLDQSSPPLGGTSPSCQYTLPSPVESKDDFPLRKTGVFICMHTYMCTHVVNICLTFCPFRRLSISCFCCCWPAITISLAQPPLIVVSSGPREPLEKNLTHNLAFLWINRALNKTPLPVLLPLLLSNFIAYLKCSHYLQNLSPIISPELLHESLFWLDTSSPQKAVEVCRRKSWGMAV